MIRSTTDPPIEAGPANRTTRVAPDARAPSSVATTDDDTAETTSAGQYEPEKGTGVVHDAVGSNVTDTAVALNDVDTLYPQLCPRAMSARSRASVLRSAIISDPPNIGVISRSPSSEPNRASSAVRNEVLMATHTGGKPGSVYIAVRQVATAGHGGHRHRSGRRRGASLLGN